MENFIESCAAAAEYPKNLVGHSAYPHTLEAYSERLNEQSPDLFCEENLAAVNLLEYENGAFRSSRVRNADELGDQLRVWTLAASDPRCRFMFVHAPHSRERLKISRKMLMLALSYHQVIPSFLDFLFPFGRQEHAQDFHFSGFRHENRLAEIDRGLCLPDLGRSGLDIRLCYSLRSVETSLAEPHWPWSIRQTAISHSFDIENGQSTWIVIKGNQLIKKRIVSATESSSRSELSSYETRDRAFSSTLATHLLVCNWAGENWRWYVSFLEQELQKITRQALAIQVTDSSEPPLKQAQTSKPELKLPACKHKSFTWPTRKATFQAKDLSSPPSSASRPLCLQECPDESCEQSEDSKPSEEPFSFSVLQRTQFIEERANEVLLVLKVNNNVLAEMRQHYASIIDSEDCPSDLSLDCRGDVARFERRVAGIEHDLRMQQARTETLLRLLADRKSLLYGILEYQGMQANRGLAEKAQLSAEKMEKMTRDMHAIARKTKQETVSMRIITLVTLFFLPGTFISTLMSTDIITFQTASTGQSIKTVQLDALQLYVAISLPLMLVTFAAWWGVYWWFKRHDEKNDDSVFSSDV